MRADARFGVGRRIAGRHCCFRGGNRFGQNPIGQGTGLGDHEFVIHQKKRLGSHGRNRPGFDREQRIGRIEQGPKPVRSERIVIK